MKQKKTTKADLRNRRALFFEIGFIVALAAAIFAFSMGQTEKTLIIVAERATPPDEDIFIPATEDKRPEVKPMKQDYLSDYIRLRPDNYKIETEYKFPDAETFVIEIPKIEEEEDMTDVPPLLIAEEMPVFDGGGLENFRRWVFSQIVYPSVAIENNVQGRVQVRFVVEKDGTLSNIEVDMAPDRTLADETVRVLQMSPKWTPGKQRGKPVRILFVLPVDYRLGQ